MATTWTKTEIRLLCPTCRAPLSLETAEGEFYTSALRLPAHEDDQLPGPRRPLCGATHRPMVLFQKEAADVAAVLMGKLQTMLGR